MPPTNKRQFYRQFALRMDGGVPSSLDLASRSVEMIAATENPVRVYDWDRGWIHEILLMSGLELPENRQVPLQDTHSRYDTSTTIGSFREMRIEGDKCVGRALFADVPSVEDVWVKVRDGHITDCSVGWVALAEPIWVPEATTMEIEGRSFTGPIQVVTKWKIKENSICPIGADESAKARAEEGDQPPSNKNAHNQKDKLMDAKLRAYLERRGLPKDATDPEAEEFMARMDEAPAGAKVPGNPPAGKTAPVVQSRSVEEVLQEERDRTFEINTMCRQFGCETMADQLIKDGTDISGARKLVMDEIAKTPPEGQGGFGHRAPIVGTDDREKFRDAAQGAILMRAGIHQETPAPGADELAGRSLVGVCRMLLERGGESGAGRPLEVVGRALTSTDMPTVLGATANLSLMAGYESDSETWDQWCDTGSVSDFKIHTAARASEVDDLDEIPESEEYSYSDRSEKKEQYAIATYGKIFAITRQALINDDLGALTDVPFQHGEAAKRKIGDVAYAVLIANSVMGDNVALFHASSHKNIMGNASIGESSMAEGIKMMRQMKDMNGKRRLNLRAQYVIAPTSLEGSSEVFFASEKYVDADTSATRNNIYSGNRFTRIYEPRLDDYSDKVWFMAGPKGKTVKVFFLDGIQAPYLEMQKGWSVDGVEHKVRIDAGAKAMDWRALLRNQGQ
ncbi:MAG: hypothetical protein COA36_11720 [Desulfotalea sp.]|nr:MAG: hypothetical protein COA36_11720 [Desulfotalea sp.]